MTEALTDVSIQEKLDIIRDCVDIESVLGMLKQMNAIKVALESVNLFYDQSVKFAKLHAEALIRVCELGGINKLYGPTKGAATWLFRMNNEDRARYIAMCNDGLTIVQIYRREVVEQKRRQNTDYAIMSYRENLLTNLKDYGYVDMSSMPGYLNALGYPVKEVIQDIVDGTRKMLRDAGAIGIGDNSGIYVKPTPENSREVKKALKTRYISICKDINNMHEITKISGVSLAPDEVGVNELSSYTLELNGLLMNIGIIKKPPCGNMTATATENVAERTL